MILTQAELQRKRDWMQWIIITSLLCVVVFMGTTLYFSGSLKTSADRSVLMAQALQQLNGMLPAGSEIIPQVNSILDRAGYPQLRRKIEVKKQEDGKNE